MFRKKKKKKKDSIFGFSSEAEHRPVLSSLKGPTLAVGSVCWEVAGGSPFPSLHAVLLGSSCHLCFLHSYISQSSGAHVQTVTEGNTC